MASCADACALLAAACSELRRMHRGMHAHDILLLLFRRWMTRVSITLHYSTLERTSY